jgi:hypothetical protein
LRFLTSLANTKFAWRPIRLVELVDGRYEWAWLERVDHVTASDIIGRKAGYRRLGVTATPLEIGKHAAKIASGQMVVRPLI